MSHLHLTFFKDLLSGQQVQHFLPELTLEQGLFKAKLKMR